MRCRAARQNNDERNHLPGSGKVNVLVSWCACVLTGGGELCRAEVCTMINAGLLCRRREWAAAIMDDVLARLGRAPHQGFFLPDKEGSNDTTGDGQHVVLRYFRVSHVSSAFTSVTLRCTIANCTPHKGSRICQATWVTDNDYKAASTRQRSAVVYYSRQPKVTIHLPKIIQVQLHNAVC